MIKENDIINLLLNHGTCSKRTFNPFVYRTVKMAHSIHVGQKFEDYQAFESAILALSKCRKCAVLQEGFKDGTKSQAARLKKKKNGRAVDRTSDLLFSRPVHY